MTRPTPDSEEPRRDDTAPPGAARLPEALDLPGRTRDADVWEMLARWRAERRRFILATVVESRGFTPRKPGAHMLLAAEGVTVGTIGGGAIESEVLAEARRLLDAGGAALVKRHLTQELGMCCGGEMTVFLERVEPAPRLFVFGAGYIAKPLAAIAAGCGFEVTVVDGRPAWATPERFPTSTVRAVAPDDFARALETTPDDYAVVVTHDHALDQRIVQELLRRPLHFVGMIGSIPKQRKFALRLRARGFSDEQIARLRTPLGVAIGASTPEEIAVSAMAEIVAARRGVPLEPGWVPSAPRVAADAAGEAGVLPKPSGREPCR